MEINLLSARSLNLLFFVTSFIIMYYYFLSESPEEEKNPSEIEPTSSAIQGAG